MDKDASLKEALGACYSLLRVWHAGGEWRDDYMTTLKSAEALLPRTEQGTIETRERLPKAEG